MSELHPKLKAGEAWMWKREPFNKVTVIFVGKKFVVYASGENESCCEISLFTASYEPKPAKKWVSFKQCLWRLSHEARVNNM